MSRHAIAEHHEMDELMATLNDGRTSDDNWQKTCVELIDKVRHHLKEEENEFFKDAKNYWIKTPKTAWACFIRPNIMSFIANTRHSNKAHSNKA